MSDGTSVEVKGLAEAVARLQALNDEIPKVISPSLRKGAKTILEAAKSLSPVRTGVLRDNIRIRSVSKKSQGFYAAKVGIGAKDWQGDSWYGAAVIFGHYAGPRKLGNSRKFIKGDNFIRWAGEEAGGSAAQVVVDELNKRIDKLAKEGKA